MAQSSQSAPAVAISMGGVQHQVNLRDYLNIRVAPFIKKAIIESLDAEPDFPLQWLGEHLIHQSILYEGNPDSTQIKDRFRYKFEAPVAPPTATTDMPQALAEPNVRSPISRPPESVAVHYEAPSEQNTSQDTDMKSHVNGAVETDRDQQSEEPKDTEMAGTS